MRFFLDRLAYYVNVGCLEGCNRLPTPDSISSFEEMADYLPNLMGNIFNSIVKKDHAKTTYFDQYSDALRACYDASYDTRELDVLIKAGMFGTEEIGVRNTASVNFFDLSVSKKEHLHEAVKQSPLKLSLSGMSHTNGFTKRVEQCSESARGLLLDVNQLNEPAFDLSHIAQLIFNHYYLQPFPAPSAETIASRSSKHFEIKHPNIPRMTHGAMHAARVAAYVKLIHQFRLEQHDRAATHLDELAESLGMTTIALIHLTQIAGLFHDVSRKDEGEDRWDHASADQCYLFLKMIQPNLRHHLDRLIANIIAFKDQAVQFKKSLAALNLNDGQIQSADYIRQLIHDADCLDIMRVRGTFKIKFLDLCHSSNPPIPESNILALVKKIRSLIHLQGDFYKSCKIESLQGHVDSIDVLEANLNAERKCEYELSTNVYQRVAADIQDIFPDFNSRPDPSQRSG